MRFPFTVEPATFVERPNRFVIHARLQASGQLIRAHCPNPGRMRELMVPGATVHLDRARDSARRTPYTLRFINHPDGGQLISLNTQLPNALFAEGLAAGFLRPFCGYPRVEREVSLNSRGEGVNSRIDFRLSGPNGAVCWVETKSATLVRADGWAHFPDAPTLRGRRHLCELMELAGQGQRAAVVFIVQRPDTQGLMPNWETDPDFASTLARARHNNVEMYAYTCGLTTRHMWLENEIPVCTDRSGTPP